MTDDHPATVRFPGRPKSKCVGPARPLVVLPYVSKQPKPTSTRVIAGLGVTAIARTWAKGDIARCQLCPSGSCRSRDGLCMILVRGTVPDADAPLFSWKSPLSSQTQE